MEQYFEYMTTPEGKKVQTTMICMEGKALQWHQAYMKARLGEIPSLSDYIRAIYLQFRDIKHADPLGELIALKQTEVEMQVRILGPRTQMKAYNQAKLIEQSLKLHHSHTQALVRSSRAILPNPKNSWSNQSRVVNLKNPKVGTKPTITRSRRLSLAKMDEKRSQGICYYCDKKYTPTHKYNRRKQLFILEVDEEGEEAAWQDSTEEEEQNEGNLSFKAQLSVHALDGISDYRTMR
ncbi:hypothetical protein T459_19485 [Capsicum annuum]|uniref:Retrotransposon gag domain-containing protein n=1 Tax=Capsicum annuum TaxID=4072 RepID=A0A2G2Z1W1_CAPAN|nr:hypothetical protein FXO37_03643 [Capsicum annuum]PHT75963.1 hypothetical protein T459_19485 [Capsicum annuum]